jgi:hypothetical protein
VHYSVRSFVNGTFKLHSSNITTKEQLHAHKAYFEYIYTLAIEIFIAQKLEYHFNSSERFKCDYTIPAFKSGNIKVQKPNQCSAVEQF